MVDSQELLRFLICGQLARDDIAREYGPPSQLSEEERKWRHDDLLSAFSSYLEHRVMGVGRTWQEALRDAAAAERLGFDLPADAGEVALAETREVLRHGAMTDWVETEDGVALLDGCW
ncbi:hypothetical protein [Streptomyces violaceusniger]|uniref:Uncharacterized protein n=1 Tax=Streptomyces violaceusniger TaxID=68280 RepID=A0A4D4LDI7_STRVO|nr:hypothetical protein SVIO_102640 [Streptomyces violaceusniger]